MPNLKKATAGLLLDIVKNPGDRDLRCYLADVLEDLIDTGHAQYPLIETMRSEDGVWYIKPTRCYFQDTWWSEWNLYWASEKPITPPSPTSVHGLPGVCLNHPSTNLVICSNKRCAGWCRLYQAESRQGWLWACDYCSIRGQTPNIVFNPIY